MRGGVFPAELAESEAMEIVRAEPPMAGATSPGRSPRPSR